jgi:group I intron endonuclease
MKYDKNQLKQTGCYVITNKIDGKRYFGSAARNFRVRWNEHKRTLKLNIHDNYYLQKAWNEVGESNIEFDIMFNCPKDQCVFWEQILLDMWFDNGVNCYNINSDAESCFGRKHRRETKIKIGTSNKGKKRSKEIVDKMREISTGKRHTDAAKEKMSRKEKGKKRSQETREKISKALMGHAVSAETLEKMSKSHVGQVAWNKGITMSDEERKKMSQRRTGKMVGEKNPLAKLNWNKVNEIRSKFATEEYTKTELAKQYKVDITTIASIVNNKTWIVK